MSFDLNKTLEALLFSSSEPLTAKDLHRVLSELHEQSLVRSEEAEEPEMEEAQVPPPPGTSRLREILREKRAQMRTQQSVYDIAESPNGFRMVIRPAYSDAVRLLRKEPRPARLSAAAMETLAIIAYRQPATRAELEKIRGVSVDAALNRLFEHGLIESTGRAELPGRPIQYGTTEKFLEHCGIRSLEDLPASDTISPNRLESWLGEEEDHMLNATDMGLPEDPSNEETEEKEHA